MGTRRRMIGSAVALGAFAALAAPGMAHADVVGPPMVRCKPNEKAYPDHGGGHCEAQSCPAGKVLAPNDSGHMDCLDPAPKSCPPGWTGVPGASCILALCDEKMPCGKGTECRPSPVCTLDKKGYSENDKPARGLFAAPRALADVREYVSACDAKNACGVGEKCRTVRVCLPTGNDRAGAKPANAKSNRRFGHLPDDETTIGGGTEAAPTDAGRTTTPTASTPPVSPPPEPSTPSREAVPPQPGRGTAGCAVETSAPAGTPSLVAVLGLGLVALVRRARTKTTR